jgi:eukaryotic-like serine/threonine-protein kinase
VVGLDLTTAEQKLRKAHFNPIVQRSASETVPEGDVISSLPPGGALARQGSDVTLSVSSGPKTVSVPLVVGDSQAVASAEIESRGLVANVVKRKSTTEQGQVLAQTPDAGTRVDQGSTVTIEVSSGAAKATVPNVIGRTQSGATSALHSKGFAVVVREQSVDIPSQDGRVIDQFPAPEEMAAKGSTVTIFVGTFTAPTPPPTTTTTPTTPTPRSG